MCMGDACTYVCTCTRIWDMRVHVHKHKTCVYMCMFTCMGRACTCTSIHALAMYVYTCRRNEYYMHAACVYIYACMVHVHVRVKA